MRHLPHVLVVLVLSACQTDATQSSVAISDSVIDFGNFIASCSAGTPAKRLKRRDYWDYGCYSGKGGEGTPVDATDKCAQTHDLCWGKVKTDTGVNCFNENFANNFNDPATGKPTDDCSKWTFAESCSKAKHPTNDKPEEEQCCACDLAAAQCFQASRPTYDPKYKDWSNNGNPGATCGPNKGKSYTCQSGYIQRGATCANGDKKGNWLRGYWCETACNKPEVCETSAKKGIAYARCAAPPAVAVSCDSPVTIVLARTTSVEPPCVGDECEQCPNCTADDCGGNHAAPDLADASDNDDLPEGWDGDELLVDADVVEVITPLVGPGL